MNLANFKLIIVLVLIYPIILLLSFVSEFTYKKKTIDEIKKDSKQIIRTTSITYAGFIIAAIVYQMLGITFQE